eukprot:Filipodium_phascolosomae@DN1004_c0_g1_i1.p1
MTDGATSGFAKRKEYLRKLGIEQQGKIAERRKHLDGEAPAALETGAGKSNDFSLTTISLAPVDDFRINFLRKLSYMKVWIPTMHRPPSHQTVIIFDWDDTLLCTTHLNMLSMKDSNWANGSMAAHLISLQEHGKKLLEMAMEFGRVFIITNAVKGWVEHSSSQYLPKLVPILDRITVISARCNYEEEFPGNFQRWKIEAFLEVQRQLNSTIITNLLSVGDSVVELDAVHVMGREFAQALVKTIKLRENPTPEELSKQLELVCTKFETICMSPRSLKIGLERKANP